MIWLVFPLYAVPAAAAAASTSIQSEYYYVKATGAEEISGGELKISIARQRWRLSMERSDMLSSYSV